MIKILINVGIFLYFILIIVLLNLDSPWPWFGIAGIALIFIVPWLWRKLHKRWQEKQAEIDPLGYGLAQIEAEKIERAVFDNAIYLIGSGRLNSGFAHRIGIKRPWKPGPVYKVLVHGDTLYFCYAGARIDEIDIDIAANEAYNEQELLSHKESFSILIRDITQVTISTKRSLLTGDIQNNGTVSIHAGEQKFDLIIHVVNEYKTVDEFFKNLINVPVSMEIDKHTQALHLEEELVKNYAEHSPEKLRTLRRLCRTLNILGWVYAGWTIFIGFPQMPLAIIGLLLPTVAIALYAMNKDIVRFFALSRNKEFRAPSLAGALVTPSIGLTLLALEYNVFHTARLWIVVIIATIVLVALVLMLTEEHNRKKWLRFVIPMFVAFFAYGAVVTTNVVFDYTPHPDPANHQFTQLERKWSSTSDGRTSFNFALNVIEHEDNMTVQLTPDNFRVSVSNRNFVRAYEDNIVRLCVLPGLWGISWVQCVVVMQYQE